MSHPRLSSQATISSRSSSSAASRTSPMPSVRLRNPLSPKTSFNPLFRHSDAFTSFDASHFIFGEQKRRRGPSAHPVLRRYNSHDSHANFGDNTGSDAGPRTSANSESMDERRRHEYEARDFLERYSLPRVVRVENGEPLLLYRCFDSFTKIEARGVHSKKGKERTDDNVLHFPEGYSGWFSLLNEKGEKNAVVHTTILQLVREQVCSFISMQPLNAYASQPTDPTDASGKVQYLKTQVRAGQLFQLRAVFQHKDRPDGGKNSTRSARIARAARDKDLANRYAQLVSQNNQEFYVPLTAKGEFYETHSSMKAKLCFPGMLDKTGPLALDKDCLYKITHLLRRIALPIRVKLIAGSLPPSLPKDYTDTFILERKFQEPLLVTCTLPPPTPDAQHHIGCINLNSRVKISKCTLGFDSENRLFKSQRLQAALAFCHKNVESWYREVRLAADIDHCVNCTLPRHQCRCSQSDSFPDRQLITKEVLEKFPKSKKWYRHFRLPGKPETERFEDMKDPMDGMEKGKSIERYRDMSKLIEERFGRRSYNPVKKSASFMFTTMNGEHPNAALLKCQSLDTQLCAIDMPNRPNTDDYHVRMSLLDNRMEKPTKTKPDLIPTLPKNDNSYITERLCNEFHVKTKVQKKGAKVVDVRASGRHQLLGLTVFDEEQEVRAKHKSTKVFVDFDEIPYSHVVDELNATNESQPNENIYAEISETHPCTCKRKLCECKRTKESGEYCYVKLGSNGESVTQSDSDEAIYNTLR